MLRFNKRCGFSRSSYCLAMVFVVVFSAAWISTLSMYILRYSPRRRSADFSVFGRLWYWFDAPYSLHLYIDRVSGIGVSGKLPRGFVSFVYSCHLNNTFHIISIKMRAFYWFLHSNTNRISTPYQYQTVFGWFTIFYNANHFFRCFQGKLSYLSILFFIYFFSIFFTLLNSTWS